MTHTCPKCLGTGNISAFGHISGGRCFTCGGTGKVKGHVGVVAQAQAKPYKAARRHASGGWEVDVMSGRVWLWDGEEAQARPWQVIVRREIDTPTEIKYSLIPFTDRFCIFRSKTAPFVIPAFAGMTE